MTETIVEILDFVNHKNYNEDVKKLLKTTNQFSDFEGGELYHNNLTIKMPNHLESIVSSINRSNLTNYTFASGIGEGNISVVPHNSILCKNLTETTRSGVYITLFYVADGSGVYLSLQQGVAKIRDKVKELLKITTNGLLKSLAAEYRRRLSALDIDLSDYLLEIELGSSLSNPKSYEAANIIAKYYDRSSIHNITEDIVAMMEIYEKFIEHDLYIDNEYKALITLESEYESNDQIEFRIGEKRGPLSQCH